MPGTTGETALLFRVWNWLVANFLVRSLRLNVVSIIYCKGETALVLFDLLYFIRHFGTIFFFFMIYLYINRIYRMYRVLNDVRSCRSQSKSNYLFSAIPSICNIPNFILVWLIILYNLCWFRLIFLPLPNFTWLKYIFFTNIKAIPCIYITIYRQAPILSYNLYFTILGTFLVSIIFT